MKQAITIAQRECMMRTLLRSLVISNMAPPELGWLFKVFKIRIMGHKQANFGFCPYSSKRVYPI